MDPVLLAIFLAHLAVPTGLFLYLTDVSTQLAIIPCIILSVGAFFTALNLIPSVGVMTAAAGLSGRDLNKKDGKTMYITMPQHRSIATHTMRHCHTPTHTSHIFSHTSIYIDSPHHITSHHITSHHITSHHITSPHHTTSHFSTHEK
jgi:hypothetical protein